MGLLGEVRVRDEGRVGAVVFPRVEDRSASFALGGKGTAKGEGVCGGLLGLLPKIELWEDVLFGGDNGEGDRGDLGDELGDFVTRRNFDGERERERRRDLTAELISTWCTWVGEGKVRVPPPLFEYDMIWRNATTPLACFWKGGRARTQRSGICRLCGIESAAGDRGGEEGCMYVAMIRCVAQ
jgi:hypothetical protein